jgi:glutathione synthase/RimK-type ligase-like ATP-grasp enzyme
MPRMKHCAFLTLDERGDFVIDDEHAIAPLEALGWAVATLSWRQTERAWSEFGVVIIRSTWDYWNDVPAFLETLAKIDRRTRLANSLAVVRWNLEKTYLRDLEARAVPIVPSLWPEAVSAGSFAQWFRLLDSDELVIKPVIGANGQDAYRVCADDSVGRLAELANRFEQKPCLVQRFMPAILDEGEYSLFYFNGEFSHAILKVPAPSEFRSQEERGAEIRSVRPEQRLLDRGQQALDAIDGDTLYARIDFVRDEDGDFAVMEQELIEPSMYLRTDDGAPARFAAAIDRRYG